LFAAYFSCAHAHSRLPPQQPPLLAEEVAGKLAAEVQAAGGIITQEDIQGVRPAIRTPLVTQVGARM
jgi:hypothetical protein